MKATSATHELNLLPDEYEWDGAWSNYVGLDDGFRSELHLTKKQIRDLVENGLTLLRRLSDLRNKLSTEHQWIPVGERLPEEGARVFFCIKSQVNMRFIREGAYYSGYFWDSVRTWSSPFVVAWKYREPLPSPPEEVEKP